VAQRWQTTIVFFGSLCTFGFGVGGAIVVFLFLGRWWVQPIVVVALVSLLFFLFVGSREKRQRCGVKDLTGMDNVGMDTCNGIRRGTGKDNQQGKHVGASTERDDSG
jgi:membrane protein implicated in regulation of membrane protease activity